MSPVGGATGILELVAELPHRTSWLDLLAPPLPAWGSRTTPPSGAAQKASSMAPAWSGG